MFKTKLFALLLLAFVLKSHKTDEGMFPLSQLNQVDFKAAGFAISQTDIYNPNGIALTDALVRLGGCTGSFVSKEGLIVTNHHCVFGSVSGVSSKENDYLENGFYAADKTKELKIGLTCRITKSYEDVSSRVLDGVKPTMPPSQKNDIISKNIATITKEEQAKNTDMTIEISEMFVGYSYTLFRYQTLKDVRLVYVPPRTIGEFGGETDNWEWPKHTGDFSFVRAYVGKDGNPADYSPENIPYVPKKHLTINPKGTKEKDLVFILGYPGATYRHEPYQFLEYQQDFVLPFISEWYGWRMNKMEELGKTDRNRYLKMAGTIKSLANTKKNFEGKLYGLKHTGLLQLKKDEQEKLQNKMMNTDRSVNTQFFNIIDSIYTKKLITAQHDLLLNRFNTDCGTFTAALVLENAKLANPKPPSKKDTLFWNNWKKNLKTNLKQLYRIVDYDLDKAILTELITRGKKMPAESRIVSLGKIKKIDSWVEEAYKKSYLDEPAVLFKMLDSVPWVVYKSKGSLQTLANKMLPELQAMGKQQQAYNDFLDDQLPLLLEAKLKYSNKQFIPDANSTLRFTYGYITGYKQGLNKHTAPFTHRNEIFEKNATDNVDYRLSPPVKELLKTEQIAPSLLDPENNDLVVCMLYNMDTTGGNSGSPVMDANGNLVGVNFDRAYTATLNDYSWNADYSRSIAVDIRYVLFTMKYLNGADNLLSEMGIQL
ncbi:MAG: S46 family peptidase [Bacteroidota bacterium]